MTFKELLTLTFVDFVAINIPSIKFSQYHFDLFARGHTATGIHGYTSEEPVNTMSSGQHPLSIDQRPPAEYLVVVEELDPSLPRPSARRADVTSDDVTGVSFTTIQRQ